eukprot:7110507-Ditylum_brightwellii.AAC.1
MLDGKHAATSTSLDLINVLQNPAPPSPFLCICDAQQAALKQLAIIFHEALPAHKQAVVPLNIQQQSVMPTPAHASQVHPMLQTEHHQTVHMHAAPRVQAIPMPQTA